MDNRPIGVFDSGLGGLTAVKQLMKILPCEDIIYFGDTDRVPYGTRSNETIKKYARSDVNFLKSHDIKRILIACNTVSSVALSYLQSLIDIPIQGVVEAAVDAALKATKNKRIGVIGTKATIRSGAYQKMIAERSPECVAVSAACPLFVPLVENGKCDKNDIAVSAIVSEYLWPLKNAGVDTLILGCTHYPLLGDALADYMGQDVLLVNSGAEAAKRIRDEQLKDGTNCAENKTGKAEFFVSDDTESFRENAERFLEMPLEGYVSRIDIEKYI